MAQLFANNASTTLAAAAGTTDTSLSLVNGASFPSPSGSDFFLLTLASGSPESAWEIVKVTARSGNTATVVRAQEGTTAQAWAIGATAELRLTAGAIVSLAGNTVLYGTVDPASGVGVDGNFYINKATWFIFGPKAAGAWPAGVSLVGPAGSGGGGGLVLLEQHTAANSATLDFTVAISSTYDEYQFELLGIIPATNGAVLSIRCSTDGGVTYDTSAIYDYGEVHYLWGGGGNSIGASNLTSIPFFSDGAGSALLSTATPALMGSLRLFQPGSTANYKYFDGRGNGIYSGNSARYSFDTRAVYRSLTAVNAIRFLFPTGNIASGTIRVYGISK